MTQSFQSKSHWMWLSVLKPYFLPPPYLGVGFQKSTGGWDIKRSTFPSNLRAVPLSTPHPPHINIWKQSQSKAKTHYLLSPLLWRAFPLPTGTKQRFLNHSRSERQQSLERCWVDHRGILPISSPSRRQIPCLGSTTDGTLREVCPFHWPLQDLRRLKTTFPA